MNVKDGCMTLDSTVNPYIGQTRGSFGQVEFLSQFLSYNFRNWQLWDMPTPRASCDIVQIRQLCTLSGYGTLYGKSGSKWLQFPLYESVVIYVQQELLAKACCEHANSAWNLCYTSTNHHHRKEKEICAK